MRPNERGNSSESVVECGFSWITVKVSPTCDLPGSLRTNPCCRPDCVVSLSWSWPRLSPTHTATLPALVRVCLHPLVSTAPECHGNTRCSSRKGGRGPLAPLGFYSWFQRNVFGAHFREKRYAFDVASKLALYVTAGWQFKILPLLAIKIQLYNPGVK